MIDIGTAINSQAILWVASVATVLQIAMWLLVFVSHARAVVRKQILWPGKGTYLSPDDPSYLVLQLGCKT